MKINFRNYSDSGYYFLISSFHWCQRVGPLLVDEVKVYSWHLVKCGSMGKRDSRSRETLPSSWEMCLVLDAKEENGSIVTFIQLIKQLHN